MTSDTESRKRIRHQGRPPEGVPRSPYDNAPAARLDAVLSHDCDSTHAGRRRREHSSRNGIDGTAGYHRDNAHTSVRNVLIPTPEWSIGNAKVIYASQELLAVVHEEVQCRAPTE